MTIARASDSFMNKVLGEEKAYVASSNPKPTMYLTGEWDSNPLLHERVCCHAVIRLIHVDPKSGTFTARVKCHWAFRMQNSQDNSEVLVRGVPGVRIPAVITTVEESRVWKDVTAKPNERKTNHNTVYWKGTSTFLFEGYKLFHMQNFPYDRHIINLENIDFVWRPESESADYYKSMKVVLLTTEFVTVLPQWNTCGAYVMPIKPADTKEYAQTFNWQLRIERQEWFYIRQVFWLSYLMTIVSLLPLCLPSKGDQLANRIALFSTGMLTLVAFKYGVSDHLPCVPYATFADDYLNAQIVTVSICCLEVAVAYLKNGVYWYADFGSAGYGDDAKRDFINQKSWELGEGIAFVILAIFWTLYLLACVFLKPRYKNPWEYVFSRDNLENYFEVNDPFDYINLVSVEKRLNEAKGEKEKMRRWRDFLINIAGGPRTHPMVVTQQFKKADAEKRKVELLRERLAITQINSADVS